MSSRAFSSVLVLLRTCRPAHVVGLVVAVVIDAVNLQRGRLATANIAKEGCITSTPLRTNADTAPTVIFERLLGWVVTPRQHRAPDCVFRCTAHAPTITMRLMRFASQAAATLCTAIPEFLTAGLAIISTSARAEPACLSIAGKIRHTMQNAKSSARLSGHVDSLSRHNQEYALYAICE